jgi:uncharacterized protein (TIGR04255 family)
MAQVKLPTFRKPPVVETVLGVQFDPLPKFQNAHLGAFWRHLLVRAVGAGDSDAHRWINVNDAPPIEPAYERFEDERNWGPELTLRLTADVACRLQIRNADGSAMVQVQNGRLHYNWIGQAGEQYRRYAIVRPVFDMIYGEFLQFVQSEALGDVRPNQWEVTYVNHIPKGTVWGDPSDWPKLFVGLPGVWAAPSSVQLESVGGSWHFEIPPQRGRLHVDLKHAKTQQTAPQEILRLTLTARGPIGKEGGMKLAEGLDLGRRAIVLTFREITSSQAHAYWKLES